MLSLKRQRTSELLAATPGFFVPAIDEFGGYSSRLRIPEMLAPKQSDRLTKAASAQKKNPKTAKDSGLTEDHISPEEGGCGANLSLCHLLGIDVERLAVQIVEEDLASRAS